MQSQFLLILKLNDLHRKLGKKTFRLKYFLENKFMSFHFWLRSCGNEQMTLAAPLFSFGFNGYVSIWNVYEHIYKMNKAKMIKFWKVTPEDASNYMDPKNSGVVVWSLTFLLLRVSRTTNLGHSFSKKHYFFFKL